jgi:hypothetical protein
VTSTLLAQRKLKLNIRILTHRKKFLNFTLFLILEKKNRNYTLKEKTVSFWPRSGPLSLSLFSEKENARAGAERPVTC